MTITGQPSLVSIRVQKISSVRVANATASNAPQDWSTGRQLENQHLRNSARESLSTVEINFRLYDN